jgi:hypothetical protein
MTQRLYQCADLFKAAGVGFKCAGSITPHEFATKIRPAMDLDHLGVDDFSGTYSGLHGQLLGELRELGAVVQSLTLQGTRQRSAYRSFYGAISACWNCHYNVCAKATRQLIALRKPKLSLTGNPITSLKDHYGQSILDMLRAPLGSQTHIQPTALAAPPRRAA